MSKIKVAYNIWLPSKKFFSARQLVLFYSTQGKMLEAQMLLNTSFIKLFNYIIILMGTCYLKGMMIAKEVFIIDKASKISQCMSNCPNFVLLGSLTQSVILQINVVFALTDICTHVV